jgi:hypothetical protein
LFTALLGTGTVVFRDRVTLTSYAAGLSNIRIILPLQPMSFKLAVPAGTGDYSNNINLQLRREGGGNFVCMAGEFTSRAVLIIGTK